MQNSKQALSKSKENGLIPEILINSSEFTDFVVGVKTSPFEVSPSMFVSILKLINKQIALLKDRGKADSVHWIRKLFFELSFQPKTKSEIFKRIKEIEHKKKKITLKSEDGKYIGTKRIEYDKINRVLYKRSPSIKKRYEERLSEACLIYVQNNSLEKVKKDCKLLYSVYGIDMLNNPFYRYFFVFKPLIKKLNKSNKKILTGKLEKDTISLYDFFCTEERLLELFMHVINNPRKQNELIVERYYKGGKDPVKDCKKLKFELKKYANKSDGFFEEKKRIVQKWIEEQKKQYCQEVREVCHKYYQTQPEGFEDAEKAYKDFQEEQAEKNEKALFKSKKGQTQDINSKSN